MSLSFSLSVGVPYINKNRVQPYLQSPTSAVGVGFTFAGRTSALPVILSLCKGMKIFCNTKAFRNKSSPNMLYNIKMRFTITANLIPQLINETLNYSLNTLQRSCSPATNTSESGEDNPDNLNNHIFPFHNSKIKILNSIFRNAKRHIISSNDFFFWNVTPTFDLYHCIYQCKHLLYISIIKLFKDSDT